MSYHRSTCFAFYEHPIIAPKESQRNPGNLASFGIKNAGRSTGQDELVVGSRVDEFLAFRLPLGLLKDDVILGDHALELTPPGGELVALPTYTAMLALRDIVARRGFVRQYWEAA